MTMLKTVNIGKKDKDLEDYILAYEQKSKGGSVSELFKKALRFYIEGKKRNKTEPLSLETLLNDTNIQTQIANMVMERLKTEVQLSSIENNTETDTTITDPSELTANETDNKIASAPNVRIQSKDDIAEDDMRSAINGAINDILASSNQQIPYEKK